MLYDYNFDSYHSFRSTYAYLSYYEPGTKTWIRIDSGVVLLEKGTCSFSKNFSINQSGRRLTLSSDNGTIAEDLHVLVDYTIINNSGDESPTQSLVLILGAEATSINSSNISSNFGDSISINYISFNPGTSLGYTLYVNGYSGGEAV